MPKTMYYVKGLTSVEMKAFVRAIRVNVVNDYFTFPNLIRDCYALKVCLNSIYCVFWT